MTPAPTAPAKPKGEARYIDSREFNRQLGRRLRDLRKRYGWTQQQLAERASMKQHTVSRYESGEFGMSVWQLALFSDVFAITAGSWFVADTTWQQFVRQL